MTKQKKFITCDGNQAAAHISYITYQHVHWQAMHCVSSVTTRTLCLHARLVLPCWPKVLYKKLWTWQVLPT